jgi:hypothetical protein
MSLPVITGFGTAVALLLLLPSSTMPRALLLMALPVITGFEAPIR